MPLVIAVLRAHYLAEMRRLIPSLLLALVLAFTSQSMAVARGAAAAAGQMVLCTGTGPIAVYVDANGKPTSAPHICPDAAFQVLVEGASTNAFAPRRILLFASARPAVDLLIDSAPPRLPRQRGPPKAI